MNCIVLENFPQGSEEWLQARKGRATASEAKSIMTPTGKLSKSATGYMRKLARECVIDDPMQFIGNKYTEWGQENEPRARDLFSELTGLDVHEVGFCVNKRNPILGCSPDGLIAGLNGEYVAGLEIKCPSVDKHVEYLLEGVVPDEYLPQVHWSMMVTGLREWHFMSFFPGLNPLITKVCRDDYTAKMEDAATEFVIAYAKERDRVLAAIMPRKEDVL